MDLHKPLDKALGGPQTPTYISEMFTLYARLALFALVAFCSVRPLCAEQLIITPDQIQTLWSYPSGALTVSNGQLQPVSLRKNINPLARATVRGAGDALSQVGALFDGDRQTGWSPRTADPQDWWVEIDLGQVLPVGQLRLSFDPDSAPLSFFTLSLSKGERFINSANVVVEGTLIYSHSERFAFNSAHELTVDLSNRLVRVVRIEADRASEGIPRLLEMEMSAYGDNIALDLVKRGGSVDVEAAIVAIAGTPTVMFDGDLSTMWRVNPLAKGSSGGSETFGDYRIDLGATYRIDSLWLLGEPLGVPPRLRHFYANFLSYKVLHSDGSLAPDGSLAWRELITVPTDIKNLLTRRNFHHVFDPIAARYVRLFYPTSEGGNIIGGGLSASSVRLDGLGLVSEFQVYGTGYPARVVLHSPILDLAADWNVTALDWQADIPPGARMLVRSRSGNEVLEEKRFFDKNGKEVTQKRYDKLIASFRGPVETTLKPGSGWSPWSEAYTEPGSLFRSPSPRRYVQLELELLSDSPQARAALSELSIQYTRPLANTALGEVQPLRVEAGQPTEFTYYLQPRMRATSQGFGRIAVESSVPMRFTQLRIDGAPTDATVTELPGGFRLHLGEAVRSEALLAVDFEATIYQNNTRFRAFLEREVGTGTTRQQVDSGDALPAEQGSGNVVTLPVDDTLVSGLRLSGAFTPNGDGINDALSIQFDVLKLLNPRPIRATIHDLQGRLVRTVRAGSGVAGRYQLSWDGRDKSGQRVRPGLYLFRLHVDGDASPYHLVRTVAVSY